MTKNTRFTQKTPDNKSKLTHSENTLKLRCNAKHMDVCTNIKKWKHSEKRKKTA